MVSFNSIRVSVLLLLLVASGMCEQWVEVPGKRAVFYDRDSFETHEDYQSVRMKHTLSFDGSKGMIYRQDVTLDYKQRRLADLYSIKPDGSLERLPEHPQDKDLDWQPIKRSKDRDFYKSIFDNK